MSEIKKARTKHPVIEIIRNRWSPRALKNDTISDEQLATIFEAAGLSFSANNLQPWHYTYARSGTEGFQQIFQALAPGNQVWAKDASVLLIASANTLLPDGKENKWAKLDLGSANALLALQAQSMGIYTHFMAGFDTEQANVIAGLPEGFTAVTVAALGYLDQADKLPEPYQTWEKTARSRKDIAAITTPL